LEDSLAPAINETASFVWLLHRQFLPSLHYLLAFAEAYEQLKLEEAACEDAFDHLDHSDILLFSVVRKHDAVEALVNNKDELAEDVLPYASAEANNPAAEGPFLADNRALVDALVDASFDPLEDSEEADVEHLDRWDLLDS
jgi:hypothetical protein